MSVKEEIIPITLKEKYAGGSENSPLTNDDILRLTNQQSSIIYGPTQFAMKYRVLPCIMTEKLEQGTYNAQEMFSSGLNSIYGRANRQLRTSKRKKNGWRHTTSTIDFLVNEYQLDPDTFLYESSYDTTENKTLFTKLYIDLENYLSIELLNGFTSYGDVDNPNNLEKDNEDKSFNCLGSLQIFHVPQTAERARTLLQQLSKFKIYPVSEATLQMVCHDERRGFYTSSIHMKKPHIPDLKLHYGDDFPEIHEELIETLQEEDSTGITLLHGPPGTGKTYYLRYLINEIKDKSLIYVPPDMVKDMTKPGFLPFLMKNPNSILIVEDAENIIRDRQHDSVFANQAVSNLLNLSDGLLGDVMHQQIICTFNCDMTGIDPALLRDGRLVLEHKFDKLSIQNARRLCVELGIPNKGEDIAESITIAEIYARKNALVDVTANNTENGETTTVRTKRQKKKKAQDPLFGFYS
ncbi:unnamed protein product [Adineta ricciae]|uniref:AAA+ ATPase domain-containing protein n=1 Tax=Adineta ricciae TaxID=249248 RepID=A0A814F5S4_ADIRI|nr:unnamed protein product [Adineta ricciae]CAF1343652.1 unnamed protein product [Adineta ricciae]